MPPVPRRPRSVWLRSAPIAKWICALALVVALIIWVEVSIGWRAAFAPWQRVSMGTLALAVGLSALSYFLRGLRLYLFGQSTLCGHFLMTLRISVIHTLWNNLLPLRTGELALPLLMKRHLDRPLVETTARLIWLRLLDATVLFLFGLTIVFGLSFAWPAVALGVGVAGLWALQSKGGKTPPLQRLGGVFPVRLGLLVPSPRSLAQALFWTVLVWLAKLAALATIILSLVPMTFLQAFMGIVGAEVSSILPINGIAGAGTYEAFVVAGLTVAGQSVEGALLVALNLHVFVLACSSVFAGFAWLSWRP